LGAKFWPGTVCPLMTQSEHHLLCASRKPNSAIISLVNCSAIGVLNPHLARMPLFRVAASKLNFNVVAHRGFSTARVALGLINLL
jgi:hypothetical protein